MYKVLSFENENIPGMMLPEVLWADVKESIEKDPFEEEVVSSCKNEANVLFKEMYLTSHKVNGEPIRVYAYLGIPEVRKPGPAILHLHGGGQTLSRDWVAFWTSKGYTALSFDYVGKWKERPRYTVYPAAVSYCNQATHNQDTATPDVHDNCWYHWTYISLRMLTYLRRCPTADPHKIGIYGISMGGTLTWKLAGLDHDIAAAVPIYGAGFDYPYRHYHPYDPDLKLSFTDNQKKYISALSSEVYASRITCPLLYMSGSNDFHGDFDWASLTLSALPDSTPRWQSIGPNFNHHICYDQLEMLPRFMDSMLRGDRTFRSCPRLSAQKGENGKPCLVLTPEDPDKIQEVRLFYNLGQTTALERNWEEAQPKTEDGKTFYGEADVLDLSQNLFAYASVRYKDGLFLSTTLKHVIPARLGCTNAGAGCSSLLYDASEGPKGWGYKSHCTDPLPHRVYRAFEAVPQGICAANSDVKLWTFRLYDPRFQAPAANSRLKITFAGTPSPALVTLQNSHFSETPPYTCQKVPEAPQLLLSCEDLKDASGTSLPDWQHSRLLTIEGMESGCCVNRIEWI